MLRVQLFWLKTGGPDNEIGICTNAIWAAAGVPTPTTISTRTERKQSPLVKMEMVVR
jgi:hypothetical protein